MKKIYHILKNMIRIKAHQLKILFKWWYHKPMMQKVLIFALFVFLGLLFTSLIATFIEQSELIKLAIETNDKELLEQALNCSITDAEFQEWLNTVK